MRKAYEHIHNTLLVKIEEFNRICAIHDIRNVASGEVMKKCKMTYEGTLREIQFRNNEFCSLAVYSILRSEWIRKCNK